MQISCLLILQATGTLCVQNATDAADGGQLPPIVNWAITWATSKNLLVSSLSLVHPRRSSFIRGRKQWSVVCSCCSHSFLRRDSQPWWPHGLLGAWQGPVWSCKLHYRHPSASSAVPHGVVRGKRC